MTCAVGCSLGGIAAQSGGKFHFHVNDPTSVTRDPAPTLADVDFSFCEASTVREATTTDRGGEWQ